MIDLIQQLIAVSDPDQMYNLAACQLQNLPFHIYSKDLKGKYLACNDTQAIILGFGSAADLIGLTDFEMCAATTANILHMTDRSIVFQGKPRILIEHVVALNDQSFSTFSCKLPLRTSTNKIIGIFGLSFVINKNDLLNALLAPDVSSTTTNPHSCQDLHINTQNANTDHLTQRQKECLYCLVQGMTIKQIATELTLSPRTVEHHIESIKNKLRCNSRSELIAKALKLQFIIDKLIGH